MTLPDRRLRLLLAAAVALICFGLWAFVLRGADGPADPVLGAPAPSTALEDLAPPGDPDRVPLPGGFGELAIAVEPAGGGDFLTWCLLAARDQATRGRGLMEVTDPELGGYSGMAFVYPQDTVTAFYMKDTLLPLSIVFLDGDGDVVTITDMEPCGTQDPCPTYPSGGPFRTAIEVPKGRLPSLGITPGARVTQLPSCAPQS